MTSALLTLLSIRATGESVTTDFEGISAAQRAGRAFAYAAVIGAGSILGIILGVVIALFSGFIQVC